MSLDKYVDESNDAERDAFLAGLQGNILESHKRRRAFHVFVSFGTPTSADELRESRAKAKAWIGTVAARVTSALHLRQDTTKTETFTSLLLSSEGYRFLGERRPRGGAFRDGMKDRRERLNDAPVSEWDEGYRGTAHALVILAQKDKPKLEEALSELETEVQAWGGAILVAERGEQLGHNEMDVEHFGYADGISQPVFFENTGTSPGSDFNQLTELRRVLVEDRQVPDTYGSYFVFRKLEQNVRSFNQAVAKVANTLGINTDLAGAMAVGRFKDGTPLALAGSAQRKPEVDFNYDDDEDGGKTPIHAHIRKTNPRGEIGFFVDLFAREKTRRIARRAMTYGRRAQNLSDEPTGGVGLLFMCYQSDIKDQFEFMQRTWSNNPNFLKRDTGVDPVIGQAEDPSDPDNAPSWPNRYGAPEAERTRVSFGEHVRNRGGEYFFAPSMKGLQALGN